MLQLYYSTTNYIIALQLLELGKTGTTFALGSLTLNKFTASLFIQWFDFFTLSWYTIRREKGGQHYGSKL